MHHNKTAGNFPDAECETIALDADADEIARDLEGLHFDALSEPGLASRLQVPQSESQTFLPSSGSEVPSDTVNMQIPIHDDIDLNSVADHDDIYEPLQPPGIVHRDVGSGSGMSPNLSCRFQFTMTLSQTTMTYTNLYSPLE